MDLSLQVGKYDIQQLLGKGATGTVYLARDTFSGREVALKVIEQEVFRNPEFGTMYRAQFLNEASLAGKLKHPHIVTIYDAVVQEDSGHIAMELLTGGDLSRHVTPETLLPIADVLQIGFKCCGALDYAFREGIVHRDIKPANLMIAQGTEVKIADFGAALLRQTQTSQTSAMGSPYYMSPEQIEGRTLTLHSDMYSLGVSLYELLTGSRPFNGTTMEELIGRILRDEPAPPSSVRADLPKDIDRIILQAIGKRPEHRYASWTEFALDLSKVVRLVLPVEAISDSEKYVALKRVPMLAALADSELWELARAGDWKRVKRATPLVKENEPGQSFFFLAQGQVKVIRQGRLLNTIDQGECFGEMAYIRGGDLPRHATVESLTDIMLAEFAPESLAQMSLGAQLALTRALVRNVVDRLELANSRVAR